MNAQQGLKSALLGLVVMLLGGIWNHFGSGKPLWQTLSFIICLVGLIHLLRSLKKWWKNRKKSPVEVVPEPELKNKLT
jgi:hypothetical protein